MEDDLTLLNRFARFKDDDAFTELVRRHIDLVYGVCLRRTGNRELSEELVQNVFASLTRKADSLKPGALEAVLKLSNELFLRASVYSSTDRSSLLNSRFSLHNLGPVALTELTIRMCVPQSNALAPP